jgi:metal transporter CNNM
MAEALTPGELALRVAGAVALLCLSALFSGLTLGLLGLGLSELEIVKEGGSPSERGYAAAILPVRAIGNRLLCTLVLGNVATISLISILMSDLTDGLVGFLLSTVLTVVFGEIIPQAVCARYALYVGAKAIPLVNVILFLLYPAAAPLAAVLDYVMGAEIGALYSRTELAQLVAMHVRSGHLGGREGGIIGGALAVRTRTVKTVMTPLAGVFSLVETDALDYATCEAIFRAGYSRVPVFDAARARVVGVLLAKDLLLLSPAQAHPVAAVLAFFARTTVTVVDDEDTLEAALKTFAASRTHFAVVRGVDASDAARDPVYTTAGVVTLEDVLEVYQQEGCEGAIVQFGGQTPLKLAKALERGGLKILGTSVASIDMAEDREQCEKIVRELRSLGSERTSCKTLS